MENEQRYYVDRDYQMGTFGMYRDYTIEQWQKQALEWCFMDENVEIATEILALQKDQILPYIAMLWDIHFRKTRKDKKIKQEDIDTYNDQTLEEFYSYYFGCED